jgi:hypothetical protein
VKKSQFLNKFKSNYLQSIKGQHRSYNKIIIERDKVVRKIIFKDMKEIQKGSYQPDRIQKDEDE